MGKPRVELQALLEDILGSENVYFQPPSNIQLEYPCIIYGRDAMRAQFADNSPHVLDTRYSVTYIDRKPDSDVLDKLSRLASCTYVCHFNADDLNHDNFNLYF